MMSAYTGLRQYKSILDAVKPPIPVRRHQTVTTDRIRMISLTLILTLRSSLSFSTVKTHVAISTSVSGTATASLTQPRKKNIVGRSSAARQTALIFLYSKVRSFIITIIMHQMI